MLLSLLQGMMLFVIYLLNLLHRFSLGSIILVKYLSEIGADSPFLAAASLSNPVCPTQIAI